ncbi:MAG: LysM peptidoglycan-binding domain-containing protein [Proteobacteria bacterium]|nr:LysM peptidoglycan-binding domain-containing protein [Pseudomonadota bacterium]
MKSTIKLYFVLSGLVLFQACTIPGRISSTAPQDINHSVKPGESLAAIASSYGCRDFKELAFANGIPQPYNIHPSQNISIPASICYNIPNNYPSNQTVNDYYTVIKGDNLYGISKMYSISLNDLANWNRLEPPYTLSVGQQLIITSQSLGEQLGSSSERSYIQQPTSLKSRSHKVSRGENLYRISKKYGYSILKIAQWNDLSKPYVLSVGQRLIVSPPGYNSNPSYSPNSGYNFTPSHNSTSGYNTKQYGYDPNPGYNPNYATHHKVMAGETLQNIANRYGLTVENLSAWNGLGGPYSVFVGQILRLTP